MNWWPFGKKTETRELTSWDLIQGTTATGTPVSPEKASGHAVAHRCISVIAETLASVPLSVYRKTDDGGREKAADAPLYGVLHDQMSPTLTAFEGREWLIASILTAGNAFAKIERNGRGQVVALHPLVAGSVAVEKLANGRLRYKHLMPNGGTETLLQDEILHLRYRTKDGIVGQSPIAIASATFGLAIAQSDQAGAAAANAFRPSGILAFPDKLAVGTGVGSKEDVIAKFRTRFIGQLKAGDPIVLDGGATWSNIAFSSKDSEFLESRKLSNLDICRVFGVPPSVAGITDDSTYSNIGEESRALVQRCLMPMARRIETAMMTALLSPDARRTLYLEHDLNGLLRGTLAERYSAFRVGREGGWLSVNEIRAMENMSKIEGGDEFIQPLNMGIVGANDNRSKVEDAA